MEPRRLDASAAPLGGLRDGSPATLSDTEEPKDLQVETSHHIPGNALDLVLPAWIPGCPKYEASPTERFQLFSSIVGGY